MGQENLVGEYLRARRELVRPQDVGVPDLGGRRRVPGLRREEVAMLAGVSSDYYVRLEQGRDQHPREFMAMCAIAQPFGRPGTPTDPAWIESLFSHVKAEWPHLDRITDPEGLRAELADVRRQYNTVRLDAGVGYVTPDDEHQGHGPRIRAARKRGLRHARWARITYHRIQQSKANRRSSTDVD